MDSIQRDYAPFLHGLTWMPRAAWAAKDEDPDSAFTGMPATITGEPGSLWISGPIPMPLDHDNLRVTVGATLSGGRLGIEWCQAKRCKFRPIVWGATDASGVVRLADVRAVRTTASFRLVVELPASGAATMNVTECRGEMEPRIAVLVNQVGYNVGHPKTLVVQANGPIAGKATFRVVAPIAGPGKEFVPVFEGALVPAGTVDLWGRTYWRGDFTPLDAPNNYYVEAMVGEISAESPLFSIDADFVARRTLDPAHRFFWYQRCGMAIPGWHAACHLDDRVTTPEGTTIEAAGAWHDAGDYNKYNGFTPLSVYSLLYAHEGHPEHHLTSRQTGRPDVLDEAIWGAEYLRKVQDPMSGKLWGRHFSGYGYWGIPEKETDNRIGGDDDRVAKGESSNPWLVASFAHLGRILGNEEYVGRALAHWKLAYDPNSTGLSHAGQALFAANELARATGDAAFDEIAATCAGRIIACQGRDDEFDGWYAGSPGGKPAYAVVDNGLPAAALAFWARAHREGSLADEARRSLLRHVGFLTKLAANPFGISMAYTGDRKTWFYSFKKESDWHVGQNSQYLSEAWAAFLIHQVTGSAQALRFGLDQMNWVLGMNPYGLCMLHGEGRVNTATAHHRYNTIVGQPQGAVPGSVFNGIVRFNAATDLPLWDLMEQGTPRYQCNEPWLPHNAYYLLAATELATICRKLAATRTMEGHSR